MLPEGGHHLFSGHLRSFKGWIQTEACVIPSYHGMLIIVTVYKNVRGVLTSVRCCIWLCAIFVTTIRKVSHTENRLLCNGLLVRNGNLEIHKTPHQYEIHLFKSMSKKRNQSTHYFKNKTKASQTLCLKCSTKPWSRTMKTKIKYLTHQDWCNLAN